MKKFITIFALFLSIIANGQALFNTKKVYDKYDDQLSYKSMKTLISIDETGTRLIVDEKRGAPITYLIIGSTQEGSEERPVDVTTGVFGYQTEFLLIPYSDIALKRCVMADGDNNKLLAIWEETPLTAVYRTVLQRYTHYVITTMFWIRNEETESRVIYINE